MKNTILFAAALVISTGVLAQENYKDLSKSDSVLYYKGSRVYSVETVEQVVSLQNPKNVILMIGDGMGVAQVSAALFANGGNLYLNNFKYCGFSQTQSASDFVTDSSAGGTALSAGTRTKNGFVAMDTDKKPLTTILEYTEKQGMHTGLVATSAITHATPASFIAHQESRGSYEDIALDFLKTDIDVFIGGGRKHFDNRADGKNLLDSLRKQNYDVFFNLDEISKTQSGKLACLTAPEHNGRLSERKDMLPRATKIAIEKLNSDTAGFFLMVEGSQIDWGGHQNDARFTIEETLDFDRAIGEALKFAANDKQTLIIITADHETGGMFLMGGNLATNELKCGFGSGDHTGIMVPIFAYGPGANLFTGIMQNTDIFKIAYRLMIE